MDGPLLATILELAPEAAEAINKLRHKPKNGELLALIMASQSKLLREGFENNRQGFDNVEKQLKIMNKKLDYLRSLAEGGNGK